MDIIKAAIDLMSSKREEPKPKKGPAKFTPIDLKTYNRGMDTSAKSDNTKVVRQPIMSVKQANALRAEKNAAELARRQQAIATSYAARNKPFSTKQLAEETGAIGDKLRLFPNDPNSFIDEYLNPGVMIGDMASGLGSLPEDVKKGRIGKAALSVAAPLSVGALGGLGRAKTNAQFLNEVLNPIAGSSELISKIGGKKAASLIEKINAFPEWSPFSAKPEVKELTKVHKDWVKRFSTPEAKRRLAEGMGIDPSLITKKNMPVLISYASRYGSHYYPEFMGEVKNLKGPTITKIANFLRGEKPVINIDLENYNRSKNYSFPDRSLRKVYEHELGHVFQQLAFQSSPEFKNRIIKYNKELAEYKNYQKLSKQEKNLIKFPPQKPNKAVLDIKYKDPFNYKQFPFVKTDTPIDALKNQLEQNVVDNSDFAVKNNQDYFNREVEGIAHLREMRQNMLESGYIKHEYDPITEDMINDFISKNTKTDRVSSFIKNNAKNRKLLAEIFNKLPAAGAGVATTLSLANQKNNN
jgi:hypothetical protein